MLSSALIFAALSARWPEHPWVLDSTFSIRRFPIAGRSLRELAWGLLTNDDIPGGMAAIDPAALVRYEIRPWGEGCYYAEVEVQVEAELVFPSPVQPLPLSVQREWDIALAELVEHEFWHLRIWMLCVDQVKTNLTNTRGIGCGDAQEYADWTVQGVLNAWEAWGQLIDSQPHQSRLLRCVQALDADPTLRRCPE